jgi:hypothetical protein
MRFPSVLNANDTILKVDISSTSPIFWWNAVECNHLGSVRIVFFPKTYVSLQTSDVAKAYTFGSRTVEQIFPKDSLAHKIAVVLMGEDVSKIGRWSTGRSAALFNQELRLMKQDHVWC